jgi:PAS domain S-box-containing protein
MANNPIPRKRGKRHASKRVPARRQPVNRFADLQRELRTNKERWQAVIDNPFMGVTVLDRNHHFIMTNPIFQTMVGYDDKELKKLTPLDITPDDAQREINRILFEELQQGMRDNFEQIKQLQRKDGKLIWIQLYVFRIPSRGSSGPHTFGMVFDITEKMQAQDALRVAQAGACTSHAGKPHGCHGGFDRPRNQSASGRHGGKRGCGFALGGPKAS